MSTINYDKHVTDLIDELSDTGHVTHRSYKKTSVTLHHNAGRLSHQGVLNVWKTRPASAHFDIDRNGSVAQYVKVNEYAWAVGNTEGNMRSISIEMANSKLSPSWEVGEETWRSAARLAGWLFAKVIGKRPSKDNFFYHHHWYQTSCAGPFMDKIYTDVLNEAQSSYDYFVDGKSGSSHHSSKKSLSQLASEVINGEWGNGSDRTRRLTEAGYNARAVQGEVNRRLLGSSSHHVASHKTAAQLASEVINGKWGVGDDRRRRLEKAGYDYDTVQREVNRKLLGGGHHHNKYSVAKAATQVINGKWGNGADRKRRLEHAGYNYKAVQREVNRRLL